MNRSTRTTQRRRHGGFSLLEVILALAILGGSLAILGNIIRIGTRSAREARGKIAAELQCQSILTEIAAGIRPSDMMQPTPVDYPDPEYAWMYTVESQAAEMEGLLVIRVTVFENKPLEADPIRVSLVRWMIDPELEAEAAAADEQAGQTGDTAESGSLDQGTADPAGGSSSGSPSATPSTPSGPARSGGGR